MNIQTLLITAVALTLGLSACNKEEDLAQQDGIPANAVQITATVGKPFSATRTNPMGTIEEQKKFNNGDKIVISVWPGPKLTIYQFDGSQWLPSDNKYALWTSNENRFESTYPINDDGSIVRSVQKDQSTLALLAMSDMMGSKMELLQKGEVINLVLERYTSRIIMKIAEFSSEFSSDSKVTDVKFRLVNTYNSTEEDIVYIPYPQGEGSVNSTYTLLVGGVLRYDDMYISLKVGDKEMRTAAFENLYKVGGMSYTYNLIVGKEKLEIASVTVEDWTTGETIPGGQAGEMK